ncbi:MAG: recombination mediator RecR [Flavobacteriales bacterium]|nr:recombination mediator RecR [Flavobacteriales bacterium]
MNTFSSKLLEAAVNEFSALPGVGKKTALRLVLHLLKQDSSKVSAFSESILRLKNDSKICKVCYNLSDYDVCEICTNPHRQSDLICVVEDIRGVMAIENTQQFRGKFHILGGRISPMEGIGPSDLNIDSLLERVQSIPGGEVILALSPTTEGETTNFYLFKKLNGINVTVTTIARGVSFGDELEYADEITLGRSILNRIPYKVGNS